MVAEKNLLKECVCYFRERSVYEKLFKKVREKYHSLGHFGGSVTLTGLSPEEKHQLSGFFQKDFTDNRSVTISARLMQNALLNSKFYRLDWADILENYYGEALITRAGFRQQQDKERNEFFQGISEKYRGSAGGEWLERCLTQKREGYQMLAGHYKEHREELRSTLEVLLPAFSQLPAAGQKVAIPVFAARISGNPHFLDNGTLAERLLMLFLMDGHHQTGSRRGMSLEEKSRVLYDAGLLKDDLSNYTLAYGITAEDVHGQMHEGIRGFAERKEPLQLTLLTVSRLMRVFPQSGKRVYIVENPAVFSILTEEVPDETMVCGNGQLRMATLALLDLFPEDTQFWYAGDFDPEGLLIAQRLRNRYGKRLHFWKYEKNYYEKYLSGVRLSDTRKRKLDRIEEGELKEIRDAMRNTRYAAYQELLIREYLRDFQN